MRVLGPCLALLLTLLPFAASGEDGKLLLATTTSVRDSGLLDALLPAFEQEHGISVQVVAVGTGAALRMGADGNADVLLTHAPAAERKLVDAGAVSARTPFMENHFVIAGPADDPAGVREAQSAVEALQRIRGLPAPFISRGDDSGTHKREIALRRAAGIAPEATWTGFASTGAGMGNTLQVAGERRAYVLSDIGTFLAFRDRIDLVALSRPDPELRNVYSVMPVDAKRFEGRVRQAEAEAFAAYLTRPAVQARIGAFGVERFGRPLFRPMLLPR